MKAIRGIKERIFGQRGWYDDRQYEEDGIKMRTLIAIFIIEALAVAVWFAAAWEFAGMS